MRRQTAHHKTDDETDNEQLDTTNIPSLESERICCTKQKNRQGLKILVPQQMLTRLPVSLAQLKAGNNSGKLKNEIRQLLYSYIDQKS